VTGAAGSVEFITGKSDIETDFFDTSCVYTVGAPLYSSADGLVTAVPPAPTSKAFATVYAVPTGDVAVLGVSGDWKY